ncbi:uncharacterized protein NPIL_665651 [Nephila pilipes]|uniref:Uncharacterized protein n=1 Tax=Nephila pilipes TaxID=299642 RepID=A0A8X6QG56_NEPPI|nr:uncharacterized protein NPIL_665651 [Nephila pilipes]
MTSRQRDKLNGKGKNRDLQSPKTTDNSTTDVSSDKGSAKAKVYTKKASLQRQRKKTPLHDKAKKSLELDGKSSVSSISITKTMDRKLQSSENLRPLSLSIVNEIFDTVLNNASGDKDPNYLLESGLGCIKEEMKTLIRQCVENEDTLISLEKRLKETEQSYAESKKKCLRLEQKNDKLLKSLDDLSKNYERIVHELTAANTFNTQLKQVKKKDDSIIADLEKRLSQTSEQKDKLKSKLEDVSFGGKNAQITSQKEIEELTESNKLLARQKSELREVVIKQMQLTTNLRRQLLHVKAGIAQNFTEQEIMKVIEEFY